MTTNSVILELLILINMIIIIVDMIVINSAVSNVRIIVNNLQYSWKANFLLNFETKKPVSKDNIMERWSWKADFKMWQE